MSGKEETVEPYVILPFPTYRVMDQKLKKAEQVGKEMAPEKLAPEDEPVTNSPEEEAGEEEEDTVKLKST